MLDTNEEQQITTFNNEYEILNKLGDGLTSIVYLGRKLNDKSYQVAIKILKKSYSDKNLNLVKSEIAVQRKVADSTVVEIFENGLDGELIRANGKKISNLAYIVMEFVPGGSLLEFTKKQNGCGEKAGQYIFDQILTYLGVADKNDIVHRDLKLENILLDHQMNIKVSDFGFATDQNIKKLDAWMGTKSYAAPEINIHQEYDGTRTDMFSAGVLLFVLVTGHFPFTEAKQNNELYQFIIDQDFESYWKQVDTKNKLSDEFKTLIQSMLAFDPSSRPSIQEMKENYNWAKETEEVAKDTSLMLSMCSDYWDSESCEEEQ